MRSWHEADHFGIQPLAAQLLRSYIMGTTSPGREDGQESEPLSVRKSIVLLVGPFHLQVLVKCFE